MDSSERELNHDSKGRFTKGNSYAAKPGEARNRNGRGKGTPNYGARYLRISNEPCAAYEWSRRLWRKLFGTEEHPEPPDDFTIGEMMIHFDFWHRAENGNVGFLREANARIEGAIEQNLNVAQAEPMQVNLTAAKVPPGWYSAVREAIGVLPGDPPIANDEEEGTEE